MRDGGGGLDVPSGRERAVCVCLTHVGKGCAPQDGQGPDADLLEDRLLCLDPQGAHNVRLDPLTEAAHLQRRKSQLNFCC